MGALKNILGKAKSRLGSARRVHELEQELETLRAGVKQCDSYIRRLEGTERVDPEKIVWILGSPRTGSTWLGRMLSYPDGRHLWREPLLGTVLGLRSSIVNQRYLPNDEDERRAAVEATSWEALREDQKGAGKFHRKGVAGGWEEDLNGDQVRTIEAAAGPLMQELGYKLRG